MGVKGRGGGCGSRKIARKSLDELMGKDRNRPLSEVQRRRSHFSDDEFCKHYLTGFCPYTLFTNTKSDLGTCKLEHSSAMQEMWDKISPMDKATYRYEDNMQSFLEECVREVDRTIALRKRESAHKMDLIVPDADLTEQRDLMERSIHEMTDKQDYLNEEGRFDEARVCGGLGAADSAWHAQARTSHTHSLRTQAVMLQIESLQEDVKRKTKDIDDTMQREVRPLTALPLFRPRVSQNAFKFIDVITTSFSPSFSPSTEDEGSRDLRRVRVQARACG